MITLKTNYGTKGDMYHKEIITKILEEGCMDKNPRPHYEDVIEGQYFGLEHIIRKPDGSIIELTHKQTIAKETEKEVTIWTPAHTLSINHGVECNYDLSKGESPLITLRPIAYKTSIAELLWIYQLQSNDLVEFDRLLGKDTWDIDHKINNWWDEWALRDDEGNYILNEKGHPTIGTTYGEIIRRHNLVDKRLLEMAKDPDGRRHIISMWQDDDYLEPHGLKPCAYQTIWNVRHGRDGIDYLDMTLIQRSSDFMTAGCINQTQYAIFLTMFARHLGLTPGVFTWKPINVQIYDRHIAQAEEMLKREGVECDPYFLYNSSSTNFYDIKPNDIEVKGYPRELIKKKNPQMKFPIGI